MRYIIIVALIVNTTLYAQALIFNEIMSNPIGDDGGREWVELYNNSESTVDLSKITISVKGGSFLTVTPVSGGVSLSPYGYAIIGSTVGGVTKFMQDFSSYNGSILKSSMSLVNTGTTSLEIKVDGVTTDTLTYVAAKEGGTYSRISGGFTLGIPTPGEENKAVTVNEDLQISTEGQSGVQVGSQTTIAQMPPPSADIIMYLPGEKLVVAGAPALFSTYGLTRAGKAIDAMTYNWSFGDGGQSTGSSTLYRYLYPGRYIAHVEGSNGFIAGVGRIIVTVVSPEVTISPLAFGKYGPYIDITNPNMYDLDISGWKLSIDGALFSFPKNTLLAKGSTRFSGVAMGFASSTVSTSTIIKLLFPNMEEVVRVSLRDVSMTGGTTTPVRNQFTSQVTPKLPLRSSGAVDRKPSSQTKVEVVKKAPDTGSTTVSMVEPSKKDTRIASFIKSFFSK